MKGLRRNVEFLFISYVVIRSFDTFAAYYQLTSNRTGHGLMFVLSSFKACLLVKSLR